jgi:diacylglycerol kinase
VPRSWPAKFRSAFRGIGIAIRKERSFVVHVPMAVAVALVAALIRVSLVEACLLCVCIGIVLAAELFNTAIEFLSREITRDERPAIGAALDMASGAVLTVAIAAATVGSTIFVSRLSAILGWWK